MRSLNKLAFDWYMGNEVCKDGFDHNVYVAFVCWS